MGGATHTRSATRVAACVPPLPAVCSLTSLVGSVCVEMPRMKGCEAWKALCAAKGSVVRAPGMGARWRARYWGACGRRHAHAGWRLPACACLRICQMVSALPSRAPCRLPAGGAVHPEPSPTRHGAAYGH